MRWACRPIPEPPEIKARFGEITDLQDAGPLQPIAPNMPRGSITDDTEQAILVGQLLIDGKGWIEPALLARRLIEWEAEMQARGSQDLLGPSTKRAIEMILAGHSPEEAGRYGTTNGAAMRITPVGIAADVADPARFIDAVVQACQVTHNTTLGISSAAAVAAVVSAGINGMDLGEALNLGQQIAQQAEAMAIGLPADALLRASVGRAASASTATRRCWPICCTT
jgi:ADP-ribosylglycohydrolase